MTEAVQPTIAQLCRKEIKNFLNSEGQIVSWPSKRRKQLMCLFYLAERFEPDRIYSEKEVNALLNSCHTFGDPCLLRRELYDQYFVDRTSDGKYWLEKQQPTLQSLKLAD